MLVPCAEDAAHDGPKLLIGDRALEAPDSAAALMAWEPSQLLESASNSSSDAIPKLLWFVAEMTLTRKRIRCDFRSSNLIIRGMLVRDFRSVLPHPAILFTLSPSSSFHLHTSTVKRRFKVKGGS